MSKVISSTNQSHCKTLVQQFQQVVSEYPNEPALRFVDDNVSYRELDTRSDVIANWLQGQSIAPGMRVGLYQDRHPRFIASILGILKVGAAYVPLDRTFPENRLSFMVEDCQPSLILADDDAQNALPARTFSVIEASSGNATDFEPVDISPDQAAYISYTSGSTGKPKGALIPHRAVPGFFKGVSYADFSQRYRIIQHSSISWDALTLELWPTLLTGGCCVLHDERILDLALLDSLIDRHKLTALWLTASAFHTAIETCPSALAKLDLLMTGADVVDVRAFCRAQRVLTKTRLISGYGPSECTVFSTVFTSDDPLPDEMPSVPIGKPIGDRRVFLVDPFLHSVPRGQRGELYVGGPSTGLGYYNRARLTAERFVPDFTSRVPGCRLYRTGDLARRIPRYGLEFLGRMDRQVKLRGVRIELTDIERVFSQQDGVWQAAVAVRDIAGSKQLCAWIVPSQSDSEDMNQVDSRMSDQEMNRQIAKELPESMIPKYIMRVESLPMNRSGKVDYDRLPTPNPTLRAENGDTPLTPLQQRVADIWTRQFGFSTNLSSEESFFEIGGHSLLAMQAALSIAKEFAIEFTLVDFMRHPVLKQQAKLVQEKIDAGSNRASESGHKLAGGPRAIPRAAHSQSFPLSFAQERLWFLDQIENLQTTYHIPFGFRLRGAFDVDAFKRSLQQVIHRHEILRTRFLDTEDGPIQQTLPEMELPFSIQDLALLSDDEKEREIQTQIKQELQQPFDLRIGPLLRARLLVLGSEEHAFLLTLHHIICDGWSMINFARELASAYRHYCIGSEPTDAPPLLQYADYAVWQRQRLQGANLEACLDSWYQWLDGAPTVLELPGDFARQSPQSFQGARCHSEVSSEDSQAIRRVAAHHQTSPFVVMLGALSVLLSRLSGQDDLIVGVPVSGRTESSLEPLIGLFVNVLPVRIRTPLGSSFDQHVQELKSTWLNALQYQDAPLELLVDKIVRTRDLSRNPLVQVLFNFLNYNQQLDIEDLGVEVIGEPLQQERSKFDVTFYVTEREDVFHLEMVYNSSLFEHARAQQMLKQYVQLLHFTVNQPQQQLGDYSLRVPQTCDAPSISVSSLSSEASLLPIERVRRTAMQWPERCALRVSNRKTDSIVTYRELWNRSSFVADWLQKYGVGKGDVVAILADRSADTVIALLGIHLAGAAVMVLDHSHSASVWQEQLSHGKACLLLKLVCEKNRSDAMSNFAIPAMSFDVMSTTEAGVGNENGIIGNPTRNYPDLDALSYLVFTSGTTGHPRCVQITNRSLSHFLDWRLQRFPVTSDDVFTFLSGLTHDPLLRDIYTPLSTGASLAIFTDLENAASGFARQQVTVTHITPTMLHGLIADAEDTDFLDTLRWVFSGGEPLTVDLATRLKRSYPRLIVINCYGTSETPQIMGYYEVPGAEEIATLRTICIGQGISDVDLVVLNSADQQAGVGELGQIYVRTPYLALGYSNDAEETAERFLKDFESDGAVVSARVFRTGDLGRYRHDGLVEFVGRADDQIQLGGIRIEPAEIEGHLRNHPAIDEAWVVLVGSALTAALQWSGPSVSTIQLRDYLLERLPSAKVPTQFLNIQELPLTSHGKIDRKNIAKLASHAVATIRPVELLSNEIEIQLAELWQDLLASKIDDRNAHFFDAGGNSLLAARLATRIRTRFDTDFSLRVVFQRPILREMATAITMGDRIQQTPIVALPRSSPLPASFAQERLWLLDRIRPNSPAYNMPLVARINGNLNLSALEAALADLVQRHETLRTSLAFDDGEVFQIVHETRELAWSVDEMLSFADQDLALKYFEEQASLPINLEQAPLWRVRIVRIGPHQHLVLFVIHHAIFDAWSARILLSDLSSLYRLHDEHSARQLNSLPLQYGDFAHWQRERVAEPAVRAELDFWQKMLEGVDVLNLPTDRGNESQPALGACEVRHFVPSDQLRALDQVRRKFGVTSFMVFASTYAALLSRLTNQADVCIGVPVAGRPDPDLERLLGLFVNTVVLRISLSEENVEFHRLIEQVKRRTLEAMTHQEIPFEKVLNHLKVPRNLDRSPLFQAALVFHNLPAAEFTESELEFVPIDLPVPESKFDLTLYCTESNGGLSLRMEYNSRRYSAELVRRWLQSYVHLLKEILDRPERSLFGTPLLSKQDQESYLATGRMTRIADSGPTIVEAFQRQAIERPDNVALIDENCQWNYRQLDNWSSDAAQQLIAQGVKPRDFVGVCMSRSVQQVAVLLAILKTGATYVPMDIDMQPTDRIRKLFAQVGVVHCVMEQPEQLGTAWEGHAITVQQLSELTENPVPLPMGRDSDLAYIMFTSGSTGLPKAVAVTQRNILRLLESCQLHYDFRHEDVWSLFHSFAFDVSTWEIWGALLFGGTSVVVSHMNSRDPMAFRRILRTHHVTVLSQTPSAFSNLLQAELQCEANDKLSLRWIVFGGEELQTASLRPWVRRYGVDAPSLVNMYGITETCVHSTWRRITLRDVETGGSPLGRPLSAWSAFVLNQSLEIQLNGSPGELYVGGAGVAAGYWRQPTLTAARFVPDPYSGLPGARMYRSGDTVRRWSGGSLEYIGRFDRQVEIRGHRVELGEIEAVLHSHQGISQAIVDFDSTSSVAGGRLVAYLVGSKIHSMEVSEVRQYLQSRLPNYMVPNLFVPLPQLPTTGNGKLDRTKLPSALESRNHTNERFNPPQTKTEECVAEIWATMLGIENVAREDEFFLLGGNSMSGVLMLNEVNRNLDTRMEVRDLFEQPTLATFAARIDSYSQSERSQLTGRSRSLVGVNPGSSASVVLFCVHAAGGTTACYHQLRQLLAPEITLIGIEDPEVGGGQSLSTIESMAIYYCSEIQDFQTQGTYYLAGWSLGGLIAIEIARLLARAGHPVESLFLFDPPIPGNVSGTEPLETDSAVFSDIAINFAKEFGVDYTGPRGELVSRTPDEQLEYLFEWARNNALPQRQSALTEDMNRQMEAYLRVFLKNRQAVRAYKPRPFSIECNLFLPDDVINSEKQLRCWSGFLGYEPNVAIVPGTHLHLLSSPAVEQIAKRIRKSLLSS